MANTSAGFGGAAWEPTLSQLRLAAADFCSTPYRVLEERAQVLQFSDLSPARCFQVVFSFYHCLVSLSFSLPLSLLYFCFFFFRVSLLLFLSLLLGLSSVSHSSSGEWLCNRDCAADQLRDFVAR